MYIVQVRAMMDSIMKHNDTDVEIAVLAVSIHKDPADQVWTVRQLATMSTRKQVWKQMMIHNYRQVHC